MRPATLFGAGEEDCSKATPFAQQATQSPFIIEHGVRKPSAQARKTIRRHVMLGKNKGATPKSKNNTVKAVTMVADLDINESGTTIYLRQSNVPRIANAIDSGLSFIRFADSVDLAMIADVMYFASFAKKALFPLEACTAFVHHKTAWLEPLVTDAALLHTMIFSTQDYFAQARHGGKAVTHQVGFAHSLKAVQLLRERLASNDDQSKISDATLMVVLALAMHAHMLGEEDAAAEHMLGLKRIVDIRGGVKTFKARPKLLYEILRSDINMALCNGRVPLFFLGDMQEALWPFPLFPNASIEHPTGFEKHLKDEELAMLGKVMRNFTSQTRHITESGGSLSIEMLLDTVASVVYRLLSLRFDLSSADEAIRLGLLTFCARIFLHMRDVKLRYIYLQQRYRGCLVEIQHSTTVSQQLKLWLLFVGATSLFAVDEHFWLLPALMRTLQNVGLNTWADTRKILTDLIWIGMIFDRPAQQLFETCMSSRDP